MSNEVLPDHFRLAPSGSSRWLNCPGSAVDDLPSDSNPKAEAGDIAHNAVDDCISDIGNYMPRVMLEDEIYKQTVPLVGDEIASEIATSAGVYCDVVDNLPADLLFTEIKVKHSSIPDFGGTIDTVIEHEGKITIVDLKTGTWKVPAKNNTQLMCYSLLAREKFPTDEPITGIIVQPRVYKKPNKAVFEPVTLDKFEEQVREAGESDERNAGHWCRFCPLKRSCREYAEIGYPYGY